jgi:hypothetical protein
LALLARLPATIPELVDEGFPRDWVVHKLSRMQGNGMVRRKFLTYHLQVELKPTYGVRIQQLLQSGPMTAHDLATAGIPINRTWPTLEHLEKSGLVVVDSTNRPFRYMLASHATVKGLEALAAYQDNR